MKKTIIIFPILLLFAARIATATFHYVPDEYSTIQAAIDDCNNGDTVTVRHGVYIENISFAGKNITVSSTDPNKPYITDITVIQGDGTTSVVTFDSGESPEAVLTGFTITGGYGTITGEFEGIYWGAGILCFQSSPTITGNIITGNNAPPASGDIAGYGGAIACIEAGATITGNIIKQNQAFAGAGVITYMGDNTIRDNLIYDNYGTYGGGVCMLSGASLINNTLVSNDAYEYGGNVYADGQFSIVNNIISDAVGGGGIYAGGMESFDSIVYNDLWNNNGGNYFETADQTSINGNISTDPLFVDVASNNYHLQIDSVCINAGDPDFTTMPNEKDIDGDDRVFAMRVDIGADEYIGYIKPIADAGPDQHFGEIQLVTLDGSGSSFHDPCGVMEFHWTQISGSLVELNDVNAVHPVFMPIIEDEYRFELVVNDELNISMPDEVIVSIGNQQPIACAGQDIACELSEQAVLDGSGSYDNDPGDELTYSWSQVDGPNVVLWNANTSTPYFDCTEYGVYEFELIVNDGFENSQPDTVRIITVEGVAEQQDLDISSGISGYFHYPDISGNRVVYGVGPACDVTWAGECRDLQTSETINVVNPLIQPKIDGDLLVWFTYGNGFGNPWYHEPSNCSVFIRDMTIGLNLTLRGWTWSESYGHPVISGKTVVWLEHLGLDPNPLGSGEANNWWDTPFNICGADISNYSSLVYFTIDVNVGHHDPYPCHNYASDFDDVVDISGNIVVWEGDGDIYGADISDLNNISVFTICDEPGNQFDPAISGNFVVWTDQRNDGGDIYCADISELENIRIFGIIKEAGTQQQPTIDGHTIVYVDGNLTGDIKVCFLTKQFYVVDIPLSGSPYGCGPAIDDNIIVWQTSSYGQAKAILLDISYSVANGPIENTTTGKRFDYIQHAIDFSNDGDVIVVPQGIHRENISFNGRNITVRSGYVEQAQAISNTILNGGSADSVVTFSGGEDANAVLAGFTITGGEAEYGGGINCQDGSPSIRNCIITGNTAISGGGVYGCDGSIVNCTVTGNIAEAGGGMYGCNGFISNCIIWGNSKLDLWDCVEPSYSCFPGGRCANGNICTDPLFEGPVIADYHLKSEGWRWSNSRSGWFYDDVTSCCIDAGNPGCSLEQEPISIPDDPDNMWGENLRINMGAYGGTAEASIPPYQWVLLSDLTNDGLVDFADLTGHCENWLSVENDLSGDLDRNRIVNMADFTLFALDWCKYTLQFPANKLPEVYITNPHEADRFFGEPITIEVNALDADGSVVKVEFFANGIKIGEDDNDADGWNLIWVTDFNDIGNHGLVSTAIDDETATAISPIVAISISKPK